MQAKVIDGKQISVDVKNRLRVQAVDFEQKYGRKIGLAVILVGENAASKVYVSNKVRSCEEVGLASFAYYLPEDSAEKDVIELVQSVNNDERIDALLVQLPLPKHLDEAKILSYIKPEKDADGFCKENAGNLLLSQPCTKACTPAGIIELIKSTGVPISGKNAVVIGRSNIVGKPVALLLLEENATVTICHSKTKNLKEITLGADILVVAIGRKEFVTGDMVKEGSIVIDVGMNRSDGKLYGDVEYAAASERAEYITPVPGGVGPMTVAMLIANTVDTAIRCKNN